MGETKRSRGLFISSNCYLPGRIRGNYSSPLGQRLGHCLLEQADSGREGAGPEGPPLHKGALQLARQEAVGEAVAPPTLQGCAEARGIKDRKSQLKITGG